MIFIDTNVPKYLVGAPHPSKIAAQQILERAIAGGERLVTDAEVLREILHRYVAIARRDAIQPAFDALLGVVDEVFAVGLTDVERAKNLLAGNPGLSARDALHVAVTGHQGVTRIMTFDADFDRVPGLLRIA